MSAVDGIDEFAAKLAGILKEKNAAYGDAFARAPGLLAPLFPEVPEETIGNILFFARIFDKAGRITQDPLGAGEDAFLDLAGYAMLMANVQRLKRAKPKAEAPSEPKPDFEPVISPANRTERWLIRRTADGTVLQWVFTTREAADRFIANYVTGDLASALRAAVEAPSEPNGRIKRDILPYVKASEWPTGWYLIRRAGSETLLFNAYAGGFWTKDTRDATAFPSAEAATAYLRRQAELNAVPPGGTVPPAEPKADCDETFEDAAARLTPALREPFKALLVALRKASSCE